jgi:hypothetical protein
MEPTIGALFARRFRLFRRFGLLGLVLAVCWAAVASSAEPATALPADDLADEVADGEAIGGDWVRVVHNDDDRPVALQTAIVRYVRQAESAAAANASVFVDLVGAVHVGDRDYYRQLNHRFRQYDALLYELVAPDGAVVPLGRGATPGHPVGAIQNGMKNLLELEHQLERIDYTQTNFIHADMSPDEFADSMKSRDEGFVQMYFRMVGQSIGQQSKTAAEGKSYDVQMLASLLAGDRARRMKVVLAGQLADLETLFLDMGGKKGSTLITERNKVALTVLREQLAAGKQRLAVFYGAGHLTDMDQRLRREFGMQPVSITWLTAWDLAE